MIRKGKELGDWSECPFLLLKVLDKNIYLKKKQSLPCRGALVYPCLPCKKHRHQIAFYNVAHQKIEF
jgi:hypothetical protein